MQSAAIQASRDYRTRHAQIGRFCRGCDDMPHRLVVDRPLNSRPREECRDCPKTVRHDHSMVQLFSATRSRCYSKFMSPSAPVPARPCECAGDFLFRSRTTVRLPAPERALIRSPISSSGAPGAGHEAGASRSLLLRPSLRSRHSVIRVEIHRLGSSPRRPCHRRWWLGDVKRACRDRVRHGAAGRGDRAFAAVEHLGLSRFVAPGSRRCACTSDTHRTLKPADGVNPGYRNKSATRSTLDLSGDYKVSKTVDVGFQVLNDTNALYAGAGYCGPQALIANRRTCDVSLRMQLESALPPPALPPFKP